MKNKAYHIFWRHLHRSARTEGIPLRIMFEVTYRCNFRCKHCYLPFSYRKTQELKTKQIFSILSQLRDLGCLYLGFTGGEPFLRKDFMDILSYAQRCGFEIIIYTNASLIDAQLAERLSRLRINKMDITIPALSKAAFERISGVTGFRDKVLKAVELLRKKRINLGLKTCLLKENEKEIKEIKDFSAALGVLHRLDVMLLPKLNGSYEPFLYRGQLSTDPKRFFSHCSSDSQKEEGVRRILSPKRKGIFNCGVGLTQAAITPQGKLKLCVMINYPLYDILPVSLKVAWQKLKKLVTRIKPDEKYKCGRCAVYDFCLWCPAKAWLYVKNFTSCEPQSRFWAELKKKVYEARN